MLDVDSTIVAIATAHGGAIRGIVRVTGKCTAEVVSTVCADQDWKHSCDGGPALVSALLDTSSRLGVVPCDIYFWPGHRSYTRQPSAEIHTFGSRPILDAMVTALCRAGARLANPGEFTMRAFLAGRLDLTQAEAVLGVIDARSQSELQVALSQLSGGLARPLHLLRDQLLELLAHLEAGLDFVEEDIEFISSEQTRLQLEDAVQAVRQLLLQIGSRNESSGEPRVVLRGLPNVGKSSLFNALVGSERSIVSQRPATTRDFLGARIEVGDQKIVLVDTAGIDDRTSIVGIDAEAQKQSQEQARHAALQLFCIDASRPLTGWERDELSNDSDGARLVVLTKCDQPRNTHFTGMAIETSCHRGTGIQALKEAIAHLVSELSHADSSVVSNTAIRCVESLERASASLARACQLCVDRSGDELVASEIRLALEDLGAVAGVVYTDDILDRVFSRFCIGK